MTYNFRPCTKRYNSCKDQHGLLVRAIHDWVGIKIGIEIVMIGGEIDMEIGVIRVQIGEIEVVTKRAPNYLVHSQGA